MNKEGTQPYLRMYPFSPKLPSHPGCHIMLSRVLCVIYTVGPYWLYILNIAVLYLHFYWNNVMSKFWKIVKEFFLNIKCLSRQIYQIKFRFLAIANITSIQWLFRETKTITFGKAGLNKFCFYLFSLLSFYPPPL